jgi:hypothetical protein
MFSVGIVRSNIESGRHRVKIIGIPAQCVRCVRAPWDVDD